jgi:flagellar basal-body rod modification protein FlgD
MQYQDPLQPTQNSEYVSEMATFSQVEATSNVSKSVDSIQANNLVGKYVTINTDDGQTSGIVDVVTKTDKKYQITVDGKTYSASDVVSIQDSDYAEAQVMADSFKGLISKLPAVENLSASDASSLSAVRTLYNSLTAYQKQFINDADLAKLSSLENRMDAINKAKNSSDN